MSIARTGFLGLGAMGKHMARHLQAKVAPCTVFDLSEAAVARSVAEDACTAAKSVHDVAACDVIFSSLPRSSDVEAVVDSMIEAGSLKPGVVWVDTTSGVPATSKRIAAKLHAAHGVHYLDCGVAGGPAGAKNAALSAMVGGDESAFDAARAAGLDAICDAAKVVYIGPSGAGHAVKAVNNTLLAANIVTASEGLLVLAKLGVPLDRALASINVSSGRSLVTEERIPNHVLSREFDFGFALDLMRKDVGICMDSLTELELSAPALRAVAEAYTAAQAKYGPKAEHMEVIRHLEESAGGAQVKA